MIESVIWTVLLGGAIGVRLVLPEWFYRLMERKF